MNKRGNTPEVTRRVARSMYAVDVMWRIWDSHNHAWISVKSRSIWATKSGAEKNRTALIEKGRNPDTLAVQRVFVEVK